MTKIEPKKVTIAEQTRAITTDTIEKLQLAETEDQTREVINKAWRSLKELVPNNDSFRRTRKQFRDALKNAFPTKDFESLFPQQLKQQAVKPIKPQPLETPQLTLEAIKSLKLLCSKGF